MYRISKIILLSVLLICTQTIKADWLNLTGAESANNIAEIYVLDDRVKIKLEIYPDDILTFRHLIPDDWIEKDKTDHPPLEKRQKLFAEQTLVIQTDDGTILPAHFDTVEPRKRIDRQSPFAGMVNPYTKRRIQGAPEDKRVIYAEISYPFNKRPERLIITPPLDDKGNALVSIGFIIYHGSVPVIDFRYLSQPSTLTLDWQDPWYSAFENRNLTRHHKYPMMAFLYVEPRRVRLDSLMRIQDLAEMSGYTIEQNQLAHIDYTSYEKNVTGYAKSNSHIQIDDVLSLPDEVSINYFTVGLRGLEPVDEPDSKDTASLLAGVSRTYYIDHLPEEIKAEWTYFNPRFDKFPYIETDPAGALPGFIYQDDPQYIWKNVLKKYTEPELQALDISSGISVDLPYFGHIMLIQQSPSIDEAIPIVTTMLENIRTVWIERQADALKRELDKISASSDITALIEELSKLYSPEMKRGGNGSVVEFWDIEIDDLQTSKDSNDFNVTITGKTRILGNHWGHTDQLNLQFQMLLDITDEDDTWKLTDVTLIDLKEITN